MRLPLVLALLTAAICARPLPAHALVRCATNDGFSPRAGTPLPPHARLLAFSDNAGLATGYVARIDDNDVPLKLTTLVSAPYQMDLLEVDSDRTGTLVISSRSRGSERSNEHELGRYPIRAGVKMPKDVQSSISRFTKKIQHSSSIDVYDALAITIGDATPAVLAHVKIRRDAQAAWHELDAPVHPSDWLAKRTTILLGALGCTQNYSVPLLERGVDLEVTVTLVDGSTRKVTLPPHVTLK